MCDGAEAARIAGAGVNRVVPANAEDPYRGLCVEQIATRVPITKAAAYGSLRFARDDELNRAYAVTASAKSSSSISSSIGLKVESGLVESVIGLRPPWDDDAAERAAGSRDSA